MKQLLNVTDSEWNTVKPMYDHFIKEMEHVLSVMRKDEKEFSPEATEEVIKMKLQKFLN